MPEDQLLREALNSIKRICALLEEYRSTPRSSMSKRHRIETQMQAWRLEMEK